MWHVLMHTQLGMLTFATVCKAWLAPRQAQLDTVGSRYHWELSAMIQCLCPLLPFLLNAPAG